MNIQKVKELREEENSEDANLLLSGGWTLLQISITSKGVTYILGRF